MLLAVGCGGDAALDVGVVRNPDIPEGNEKALENIQAEVVATFGGESEDLEAMLGGWMQIDVSGKGQIVALDYQSSQLKSFDANGNHLWTALGPGEGPGEISNGGRPFFGPDGNIYFTNQSGSRLDVVSSDGEFLKSLDFVEMGLDRPGFQGFVNDSLAFFYKWTRGTHGGTTFIANTKDRWSVVDSFSVRLPSPEPANPLLITWLDMASVDGSIVVPNQFAFEQRMYAPNGHLLKTMVRDKDGLIGVKLVETDRGYGQIQFSRQQAPWELDNHWLLVLSSWDNSWESQITYRQNPAGGTPPLADRHESLDFYTKDWKLVWSLDADQQDALFKGNLSMADGNGHVYTYDSETGMGYKYRVSVRR